METRIGTSWPSRFLSSPNTYPDSLSLSLLMLVEVSELSTCNVYFNLQCVCCLLAMRVIYLQCVFYLLAVHELCTFNVSYLLAVCVLSTCSACIVYFQCVSCTCSVRRPGLSRTPTGCQWSTERATCVPLTLTSVRLIARCCAWIRGWVLHHRNSPFL